MIRTPEGEKGYVLFLTLAMLTATAVFFVTLHNVYRTRYGHVAAFGNSIKARYAAESGIECAKETASRKGWRTLLNAPLTGKLGKGGYSVTARMEGGFLFLKSAGYWLKEKSEVRAALGERPAGALASAIRLNTRDRDLVVAGHNRIRGDVRLVRGKAFTNQVTGFAFDGDSVCQGRVIDSSAADTLRDSTLKALVKEFQARFSTTEGCDEVVHGSLFFGEGRPFDRGGRLRKTVYVEGGLTLQDDAEVAGPVTFIVEGNVLIMGRAQLRNCTILCGRKVKVQGGSLLDQVLLYSREGAVFRDSSVFCGQMLSLDSILFLGRSSAAYPAFLYSWPGMRDGRVRGGIYSVDSSILFGTIVVTRSDTANGGDSLPEYRPLIRLSAQTRVQGVVYNCYATEYRGRLRGHITTASFFLEERGYTFGNLLFNTETDRLAMDTRLLLPVIFSDKPTLARVRSYTE